MVAEEEPLTGPGPHKTRCFSDMLGDVGADSGVPVAGPVRSRCVPDVIGRSANDEYQPNQISTPPLVITVRNGDPLPRLA